MRRIKATLGVLCATAMLTAVTAEPAAAQTFDRVTKLTFSAPVELPGMVLPAGTYTFRLVDSKSDRHVVNVYDADDEKHIHTVYAIPVRRSETSEVTVVTFRETALDAPLPVRFWYYPNDQYGQEFAWPRDRALAIAQATGESVLAIDGEEIERVEATAVTTPAPVVVATPEVEVEPVEPVVVEPEVEIEPVQPVVVEPVQPVMPVATSGELPDTAGPLPLVGLVGLIALGGAFVTRAYRRRSAA